MSIGERPTHHPREDIYVMTDTNKHNLLYFESNSMRGLYESMDEWQHAKSQRLLSVGIQQDGAKYCCIALTSPTEVVITSLNSEAYADISGDGALWVSIT